jgi:TonB-dependent Receptor Plug Domain
MTGTLLMLAARAHGQGMPDSVRTRTQARLAADSAASRRAQRLTTVVITPGTFGLLSPVRGTAQSLGRDAIISRPQLGEDLFRSIQRLPGLASNEYGAAFHVRGAETDQLHVSLDGLELFEPFHMKDFDNALSILDVQSVQGIDLVTSGFTSEYGRRLGSVLSIHSRAPRTDSVRTSLGVSVTNVRVQTEGGFAHGRGGWSVEARHGYLDLALRLAGQSDSLSPLYADLLATVTWNVSARHALAAHALWADDRLRYREKDGSIASRYGSRYGWVTWDAEFTPNLTARTVASMGHLDWTRGGDAQIISATRSTVRDERSTGFGGVRQDWLWSPTDQFVLKFGGEWRPEQATYDYAATRAQRVVIADTIANITLPVNAGVSKSGSQLGLYVAPRLRPVRWLVAEVGARVDQTTWSGDRSVSPRANVMVTLSPSTTLRLAAGRYTQPQQVFALQVQDGVSEFGKEDVSEHRVIGVERRFGLFAIAKVEAYERRVTSEEPRFINLRGDLQVFPELSKDRVLLPATRGKATGVEYSIRGLGVGAFDWAASYARASVTDRVSAVDVARKWDQPQTVYLDATWRPAAGRWRMSVAAQAHSGWPEAPVQFVLDTVHNAKGVKSTTVLTVYGPVTELGLHRMPWYHRVDGRITREVATRRGKLSAFLDVFNVLDASNPSAYNYRTSVSGGQIVLTRTAEIQLGRLPSAGMTWEF